MKQCSVHPLGGQNEMVGLAQLVEHRIVVPGVVGSSPISHPTLPATARLRRAVKLSAARRSHDGGFRPAAQTMGCSVMVTHRTLTPI